jgi:hypothetical protein
VLAASGYPPRRGLTAGHRRGLTGAEFAADRRSKSAAIVTHFLPVDRREFLLNFAR